MEGNRTMSDWWQQKTPVKNRTIFWLACSAFFATMNLIYMIAHLVYLYVR
jgi:hypothetical protein